MQHTQDAKAHYNILDITNDAVFIEDIGHRVTRSITNDAEAVVYQLVNKHSIGNKRIVYKDSMNKWSELLHDGDQFTGYSPYTISGTHGIVS